MKSHVGQMQFDEGRRGCSPRRSTDARVIRRHLDQPYIVHSDVTSQRPKTRTKNVADIESTM
jgi:hypothetical protein